MTPRASRTPTHRGRWIAAASRRLFSAQSFALLVEPAIADLQLENSGRLAERLDAYRTVWIGMAAAFDDGVAHRARTFVRENDLVTLTALALLHAAHSTWMLVLLLGLDDRVHLKRIISAGFAELPMPIVLTGATVVALFAGRALVRRLIAAPSQPARCSIVRVGE
jgi:hypothetical protein